MASSISSAASSSSSSMASSISSAASSSSSSTGSSIPSSMGSSICSAGSSKKSSDSSSASGISSTASSVSSASTGSCMAAAASTGAVTSSSSPSEALDSSASGIPIASSVSSLPHLLLLRSYRSRSKITFISSSSVRFSSVYSIYSTLSSATICSSVPSMVVISSSAVSLLCPKILPKKPLTRCSLALPFPERTSLNVLVGCFSARTMARIMADAFS